MFSQKLYEIERNWTARGGRVPGAPRSANVLLNSARVGVAVIKVYPENPAWMSSDTGWILNLFYMAVSPYLSEVNVQCLKYHYKDTIVL